jgi:hypothetical protein
MQPPSSPAVVATGHACPDRAFRPHRPDLAALTRKNQMALSAELARQKRHSHKLQTIISSCPAHAARPRNCARGLSSP